MKFTTDRMYGQILDSLDTSLLELLNQRLEGCAPWQKITRHPNYEQLYKNLLQDPKSDPFYAHVIHQQMRMAQSIEDYLQHSHAQQPTTKKPKLNR